MINLNDELSAILILVAVSCGGLSLILVIGVIIFLIYYNHKKKSKINPNEVRDTSSLDTISIKSVAETQLTKTTKSEKRSGRQILSDRGRPIETRSERQILSDRGRPLDSQASTNIIPSYKKRTHERSILTPFTERRSENGSDQEMDDVMPIKTRHIMNPMTDMTHTYPRQTPYPAEVIQRERIMHAQRYPAANNGYFNN
ncbi:unnamed protein product [Didymodactylos carnosus]|uniref:Uncharacterized protein n=1 Tax=Didymodactylos carnosus TaxID=1234261 RepID=A0A813YUQ5_9BILA|nr:unnamed protein product [Didymodactylos carnosus]CAF0889053.1 unnamed protein product [Didymodactylos carnosus]CAF3628565.1 unnamed protein product [Didymodactylos carnosus]CAF3673740.1 unnamed protein product [Didymodactylos carnosus]